MSADSQILPWTEYNFQITQKMIVFCFRAEEVK